MHEGIQPTGVGTVVRDGKDSSTELVAGFARIQVDYAPRRLNSGESSYKPVPAPQPTLDALRPGQPPILAASVLSLGIVRSRTEAILLGYALFWVYGSFAWYNTVKGERA